MLPGPHVSSWRILLLEAYFSTVGIWRGGLRSMYCGVEMSYLM